MRECAAAPPCACPKLGKRGRSFWTDWLPHRDAASRHDCGGPAAGLSNNQPRRKMDFTESLVQGESSGIALTPEPFAGADLRARDRERCFNPPCQEPVSAVGWT